MGIKKEFWLQDAITIFYDNNDAVVIFFNKIYFITIK